VLEKDHPLGLALSVISRLFAHRTQARSDFSQRRRWLSAMRWRTWIRCVDTGSPQSKQGWPKRGRINTPMTSGPLLMSRINSGKVRYR
jgi:hypothetical protein